MHFFVGFALLFVCLSYAKDQIKINDLNTVFSVFQAEELLSVDKLPQLKNEIFASVVTGLKNDWNMDTVAETLEQLVAEYVPQVTQMHIDWIDVSQSALNDVTNALFIISSSSTSGGLFHARDLGAHELRLLSQLPLDKLAEIVATAAIPDRTTALANLQELLPQFFSIRHIRSNFDDLAENMLDHLNNILPHLAQTTDPISNQISQTKNV